MLFPSAIRHRHALRQTCARFPRPARSCTLPSWHGGRIRPRALWLSLVLERLGRGRIGVRERRRRGRDWRRGPRIRWGNWRLRSWNRSNALRRGRRQGGERSGRRQRRQSGRRIRFRRTESSLTRRPTRAPTLGLPIPIRMQVPTRLSFTQRGFRQVHGRRRSRWSDVRRKQILQSLGTWCRLSGSRRWHGWWQQISRRVPDGRSPFPSSPPTTLPANLLPRSLPNLLARLPSTRHRVTCRDRRQHLVCPAHTASQLLKSLFLQRRSRPHRTAQPTNPTRRLPIRSRLTTYQRRQFPRVFRLARLVRHPSRPYPRVLTKKPPSHPQLTRSPPSTPASPRLRSFPLPISLRTSSVSFVPKLKSGTFGTKISPAAKENGLELELGLDANRSMNRILAVGWTSTIGNTERGVEQPGSSRGS